MLQLRRNTDSPIINNPMSTGNRGRHHGRPIGRDQDGGVVTQNVTVSPSPTARVRCGSRLSK